MENKYLCKTIDLSRYMEIKELFLSVFSVEPWCDDWTDKEQLKSYLYDLAGQSNSLLYGLYEGDELIGISIGNIKHWYAGTMYCIDELCIKTEKQKMGCGKFFVSKIEKSIKEMGLKHIFLQTERNVPAYKFYKENGFYELESHVCFEKDV